MSREVNEIRAVPLSLDASLEDTLAWKDSVSYKFSVSLAFKTIVGDDEEGKILSWIWKLKCVERVKMFIWIVVKGMLLTNVDRKRKGMGPDVVRRKKPFGTSLFFMLTPETTRIDACSLLPSSTPIWEM